METDVTNNNNRTPVAQATARKLSKTGKLEAHGGRRDQRQQQKTCSSGYC